MMYSKVVEHSTGFQMAPFVFASSRMFVNSFLYVDFQGFFFSFFYIFSKILVF